jgi:prolyl-tRNA editing enzyme YbaK/EbsC (Cys-tRNA(Pro) deacylase)
VAAKTEQLSHKRPDMQEALSPKAAHVQRILRELGYEIVVVEHSEPTRTAEEAARRAGCSIGQIVKSLIFRGTATGKPVLVFTSGANRVDEKRMSGNAGESLERANPDFVRIATGYPIGAVPPVGHPQPIESYLDEDLLQFDTVWASGGSESAIFPLEPGALQAITRAKVVRVRA